jgi:hypothetical protein
VVILIKLLEQEHVTESARFRTADTVRANGLPVVQVQEQGFQAGARFICNNFS